MITVIGVWFYNAIMHLNDEDGMGNSVEPDQTAPYEQSDLGLLVCSDLNWVCTIGSHLSVPIHKILWYYMYHSNIDY